MHPALQELLALPRPLEPHLRLPSKRSVNVRTAALFTPFLAAFLLRFVGEKVGISWLGFATLIASYGGLITYFWPRVVQNSALPGQLTKAVELLRSGDVAAARASLTELASAKNLYATNHAICMQWLAVVAIRQGEHDQALAIFAELMRSGLTTGWRTDYFPSVAGYAAVAAICAGRPERGRGILDALPPRFEIRGRASRTMATAMLELRDGKPEAAAALLREDWSLAEAQLGTPELKALRILLAFARSMEPSASKEVRRLLLAVHPFWPGEFDYLGLHWPELAAFVQRSGLGRPQAKVEAS